MSGTYGIKETKEVVTAMKQASIVSYKSIVKNADGSINYASSGSAFATQLMLNPTIQADMKAAIENIGDVTKEIKDLQWGEAAELAAHCATEIKAASDAIKS